MATVDPLSAAIKSIVEYFHRPFDVNRFVDRPGGYKCVRK